MKYNFKILTLFLAILMTSLPSNAAIVIGASNSSKALSASEFSKELNSFVHKSAQASSVLLFLTGSPVIGRVFLLDESSTVANIQEHLIELSQVLADLPELSLELSKLVAQKIAKDDIHPLDKNDRVQLGAISLKSSLIDQTIRKTSTELNEQDYKDLISKLK